MKLKILLKLILVIDGLDISLEIAPRRMSLGIIDC